MLVNHIAMNDVTALLYALYVTMDCGLLYLSYRVLMSKYLHLHMQFISMDYGFCICDYSYSPP